MVSYSLTVWFIWPLGAPTKSAEMPFWHFTPDLQPPTLEAGFISDRRLSPIQNQTVCNDFTCWRISSVLMGGSEGSRGVSAERRTKAAPSHIRKKEIPADEFSKKFLMNLSAPACLPRVIVRKEIEIGEPRREETQGQFLWNNSWKDFAIILAPHPERLPHLLFCFHLPLSNITGPYFWKLSSPRDRRTKKPVELRATFHSTTNLVKGETSTFLPQHEYEFSATCIPVLTWCEHASARKTIIYWWYMSQHNTRLTKARDNCFWW